MSDVEETLAFQLTACGIPFDRQVQPIPGRKFAYDFQVDDLLIEVQGGVFMDKSGHNTGLGITRDCEKHNLAVLHGYRPLLFTSKMVTDGVAVGLIEKCRK